MIEGIDKEILERLYVKEKKSTIEIARIFGCTHKTIMMRCRKYGIKLRPKGGGFEWLDKKVLQKYYVNEGKSTLKIAKLLSCSPDVIKKRCKKYGIKLRGPQRIRGIDKALLQKLYIEEGRSIREIAKIKCCTYDVIRDRCMQYGIPLRPRGGSKKKATIR